MEIKFRSTKGKKFITVLQWGRDIRKPLTLMNFWKMESMWYIKEYRSRSTARCAHPEAAVEAGAKLPNGGASKMLPT